MPPTSTTEERLREEFRKEFDPLLADFGIPWPVRERLENWAGKRIEEECRRREKGLTAKVNRVEVIDHTKTFENGGGRAYVFWAKGERCRQHLGLHR